MVIICNKGAHPFIGCYIGSRASHVCTWGRVLLWVTCISLVITQKGCCEHKEWEITGISRAPTQLTHLTSRNELWQTSASLKNYISCLLQELVRQSLWYKEKTTGHVTMLMELYLFWQANDCPAYQKFVIFFGTWMLVTFFTRARHGLYPE